MFDSWTTLFKQNTKSLNFATSLIMLNKAIFYSWNHFMHKSYAAMEMNRIYINRNFNFYMFSSNNVSQIILQNVEILEKVEGVGLQTVWSNSRHNGRSDNEGEGRQGRTTSWQICRGVDTIYSWHEMVWTCRTDAVQKTQHLE